MNEHQNSVIRNLFLYFLITFIWSWLLWLPQVLNTFGFNIPEILLFIGNLAIFGPFIAAFSLTYMEGGKEGVKALLKRGIDHRFKKIWFIPILLLVPIISGISLLIVISVESLDIMEYALS